MTAPFALSRLLLIIFSTYVVFVRSELAELECPDECDCHYFRINWVTDCSEANLTEVPAPEDGLSLNVYILNMNGNELKELAPFPHDIKLRRLQLSDNKLTKVTYEEFAGLMFLLELDLSENQITTIDPESFRDSPGMISLELQLNPLENVEGPFLVSRSLLYLDLSDCKLTKLSSLFFQNITALNKLDLSGNPLGTLESGVLDSLISLESLKLNRCNLTHISSTAFLHNEYIKILELTENSLKGPIEWNAIFGTLNTLEYLDLRRSGISNLPENIFANSTWLRSLILAENELENLDVATTLGQNTKHLEYLDLSKCHLKGPLSEEAFDNATNLKTLLLSGNHLSAADLAVALAPLVKLQKLALRNCSLTRLPANTFHRFTGLQELDISKNPLNNAFTALLSPLESLEHLDMSDSNLEHISKTTFSKMTSLKTLILSGNPLSILESGLFQNLTRLETLELNYCGLSFLNSTVFPDNFTYPDLEELRLAGNPLHVLTNDALLPRQLNRLKTLDLSNCSLSYIPPNALNSFGNITRLLLPGNKLKATSDTSFEFLKKLPQLEVLDMSKNMLDYIHPTVFKNNPNINSVKLVGNPWKCGCHIADMWEWATVVKGDVGVLVGSTTAPEVMVVGGRKKKKGLLCHFDSKTAPINKEIQYRRGRKELVDNVNRTWARYVRESACDSSARMRPARLLTSREVRDTRNVAQSGGLTSLNGHVFNWEVAAVGTALVIFGAAILLVTLIFRLSKKPDTASAKASGRSTPRNQEEEEEEDCSSSYSLSGSQHTLRRLTKTFQEEDAIAYKQNKDKFL